MKLLEKIVVDKGEDDDLPPGWKKEVKARKGSGSKTKYDRFYTDPVTGYIFHSLRDVQRYLKTGEVGRLASKPKDNGDVDMVNEDEQVHVSVKVEEREERSESVQQMSETWRNKRPLEEGSAGCKTRSKSSETGKSESPHRASKRLAGIDIGSPLLPEPKTRQATQLAANKTDAPPPPSPSQPEPKTRQATRQSAINIEDPPPSLPEPKTRQATQLAANKTNASPPPSPSRSEPKTRQATRQSAIKIEDPPPSLPEPKTRQVTRQSAIKIEGAPLSPSLPEPKTRQATLKAGIQIDSPPSSPPDVRSNRQATRQAAIKVYAPTPSMPEAKTRQAIQQAGIKIDASIPLPEPNTRQATRQSAIKIDAPSPSPSLPEPKTRQASRQAGIKIDSPPPSPPDSRKSRQATRPPEKINALVPASPPPEPKTIEATPVPRMEVDASPQLEPKTSEATRVTRMEVDASPPSPHLEPKTSKTTQVSGKETVASPALSEPKTRQAKRLTGTRDIASPESLPQPKTRKATRQSGIKIDSPPPSPPDSRTNRQATATKADLSTPKINDKKDVAEKITNNHNENTDMDDGIQEIPSIVCPVNQENKKKDEFKTNEKQELSTVIPPKTVDEHFKTIEMGSVTFPHREYQPPPPPPTVVPPVNMEKQELPAANPTVSDPITQSMNFSLSDMWNDPCIEFAVKTLTGAIPFNDLNKVDNVPPSMAMEELWTDPCIEFAVKTLTGAIPLGDTDYFNHQPASSSNPSARHDYTLPDVGRNFCQTEVLSKHFETGHNSKRQDSVASTLGNGNLQKAGNIVNGSNVQFSRSMYFK